MTSREKIELEWSRQREKWNLDDWELVFSRQRRQLGYCKPMRRQISISSAYMEINPFNIMKDTLLHEIAHAVHFIETGRMGHGNGWKEVARRVGCAPLRCASLEGLRVPEGNYEGMCPNCGKTVQFYRKVKRRYSCNTCSPNAFDPNFELVISRNHNK